MTDNLNQDMNADQLVQLARDTFRGVMDPHGYKWQEGDSVDADGKRFCWGQFVNGERKLRFAFGDDLVLVKYHADRDVLEHEAFYTAMTGKRPHFSRKHLGEAPHEELANARADLEEAGTAFLEGNISAFREACRRASA